MKLTSWPKTWTNALLITSKWTLMGFCSIEHVILNFNTINLTMTESNEEVDEVVVITYGTKSRKETSGSLTSVIGDDVGYRCL